MRRLPVVLFLLLVCSWARAQELPALGVSMNGMTVVSVSAGSAAEAAGILPGDVFLELDGTDLSGRRTGLRYLLMVFNSGSGSHALTVQRGGERVNLTIGAGGRPRFGTPAPAVPEMALGETAKASGWNVLHGAVVSPDGSVALIGSYDPVYPTGPIPYYDLLAEALESPYPRFSLEPTEETRKAVLSVDKQLASDIARMNADENYCNEWLQKLMRALDDPNLAADRAHILGKIGGALGIPGEDVAKLLKGDGSQEDRFRITAAVLRARGLTDVADAMESNSSGDSLAAFRILGIGDQAEYWRNEYFSGRANEAKASMELGILLSKALMQRLGVPAGEIATVEGQVRSGRMSLDGMYARMEAACSTMLADTVGEKMLNGLTLRKVLYSMYSVPAATVKPVYTGVRPDSALGEILFRADYLLKTLITAPEVAEKVPGHISEQEYIARESGGRVPSGLGFEAGHQFAPKRVEMRASPDGSAVAFGVSEVKIDGWMVKDPGWAPMKGYVEGYANLLTGRYENYARAYPEMHRIREAAKVIALARWGRGRLNVSPSGAKVTPPEKVPAFFCAVMTYGQDSIALNLMLQGGANFDQDAGEAWAQPREDVTVTDDVNRQLAASAALSGGAMEAALEGDLETARDLAERGARAMTGEIDLSTLPTLEGIPAPVAVEMNAAVLESLDTIAQADIAIEKASALQATDPAAAQEAMQRAEADRAAAESKLQALRSAVDEWRSDPAQLPSLVATVRGTRQNPGTPPAVALGTPMPKPGVKPTPKPEPTPKPAPDIDPAKRAALQAELEKLEKEMAATTAQLAKLSKMIQNDLSLFTDWEKEAEAGMGKCRDVLYSLMMDAAAGGMSDRYEQMYELSKKLPDKPEALISKLGRVRNWFIALKYAGVAKDVDDIASRDAMSVQEMMEEIRDCITIVVGLTPAEKTPAGAAWKYGSNIVDMTYSFCQYIAAWDGIEQMDKNTESYAEAVKKLSARLQTLMQRTKEIKAELK
ncbi:MAG: PDZ domain-containing protein [Armatimonadota bacterium]